VQPGFARLTITGGSILAAGCGREGDHWHQQGEKTVQQISGHDLIF
jgi:hypothetical protein